MSVCEVCDRNLIWGGTSGFLPHADEFHAQVRNREVRMVKLRMIQKLAARTGHRITIRFTQDWSWAECSCGWVDPYRWPSENITRAVARTARAQGMSHLYLEGLAVMEHVLDRSDGS